MAKQKKKSKEKQLVTATLDEKTDIDFDTEAVRQEEPENKDPEIIETVYELIKIMDLSEKKHIVAAERISILEKSVAGLTFFMNILLNIPIIKENLPEHVLEGLNKKHRKNEAPQFNIEVEEEKENPGMLIITPIKQRIEFLKHEAENVTKKIRS